MIQVKEHAHLIGAVRAAGAVALSFFRDEPKAWEKSPGQWVSDADHAANDFLKHALCSRYPDDGWLSEESEDEPSRLEARRVWVVDPIDGTNAFLAGRAEFTISAALVVDGAPVTAALFNPATDEMFEALAGGGARLNGAPIRVTDTATVEGACLVCSRSEKDRAEWQDELSGVAVTALGSIAYKLALVAAGQYDACVTLLPKNEWDIAAAALVLGEAGGRMTDARGAGFAFNAPNSRIREIVAAGPRLHPLLIDRLAGWREYQGAVIGADHEKTGPEPV